MGLLLLKSDVLQILKVILSASSNVNIIKRDAKIEHVDAMEKEHTIGPLEYIDNARAPMIFSLFAIAAHKFYLFLIYGWWNIACFYWHFTNISTI